MEKLIFYQVKGDYTKEEITKNFSMQESTTASIHSEFASVQEITRLIKKYFIPDLVNVSKYLDSTLSPDIEHRGKRIFIIKNKDNGRKNVTFNLIIKYIEVDGKLKVKNVYFNEDSYTCTTESELNLRLY